MALIVPADAVGTVVGERVDAGHVMAYGAGGADTGGRRGDDEERVRTILSAARATPGDALASALAALGAASGSIGLDESALTPAAWRSASEHLGAAKVTPGASPFMAARRIKGPYELECLQRSLAIAEEALDAVLQTLAPGTTEREAMTAWQAEVIKRGAVPRPGVIVAGSRAGIPHPAASDREMRAREVVRFDLGCVYKGYWSSVARTAVVGVPDEAQQRLHDAVQAGVDAALDEVKPGATPAAIHAAAVKATRDAGLPGFAPDRVGQAIGLEPSEDPVLEAGGTQALEMGEVLTVSGSWSSAGREGMALTETVLVTRQGYHVMNRSVRGLVALD